MPAEVRYELGDMDDQYTTSSDLPKGMRIKVDGGPGKDLLRGYDLNETLLGGDDRDTLEGSSGDDHLDGGGGDDTISGYSGRDTVLGGEGNDTMHPDDYEDPSADVVDGGPGDRHDRERLRHALLRRDRPAREHHARRRRRRRPPGRGRRPPAASSASSSPTRAGRSSARTPTST